MGSSDDIVEVQTNLDDLNPQIYEPLMEQLFAAGALDVTLTPVIMKRSRPGTIVTVLSSPTIVEDVTQILFQETTTLGVRIHGLQRRVLPRQVQTVRLLKGTVRVKIADLGDGRKKIMPEYQDCKKLAEQTGHPIREIMEQARQALNHLDAKPAKKSQTIQGMIKNQSKPSRPILALTMGDPAGIGPEIILKALNQPRVWRVCRPIVIGSIPIMKKTAGALRLPINVVKIDDHSEAKTTYKRGLLPIFDPFEKPLNRFRQGRPSATSQAQYPPSALKSPFTGRKWAVSRELSLPPLIKRPSIWPATAILVIPKCWGA